MRFAAPTTALAGVVLLALPAAASAQAGPATPSLASPLAACYSPKFADLRGGPTAGNVAIAPLAINGPSSGDQWSLRVVRRGVGIVNFRSVFFDAEGRASLPEGVPILVSSIGLGQTMDLTIANTAGNDPETTIGTTKAAALGVRVVRPNGRGAAVSLSRPRPVVVSGTDFANKTLYGFIVEFKPNPRSTTGDPARSSRKVLRRFKLGKADACGHVTKKVVLASPRAKGPTQLYVNAGPQLDKPRAVHTGL